MVIVISVVFSVVKLLHVLYIYIFFVFKFRHNFNISPQVATVILTGHVFRK